MSEQLRVPLTPRGQRTYERLLDAARAEFEVRGYLHTHVDHIVERAGTSHGTFYTYFSSKRDAFSRLASSLATDLLDVHDDGPAPRTLYERVERTNRHYLEAYRANARIMTVVEQVAALDDEIRQVRRDIRQEFVDRSTRFIGRLQTCGQARDDLDAGLVAHALGAMVERVAFMWVMLGEEIDVEETVHTLTVLWLRALGAEPDAPLPD